MLSELVKGSYVYGTYIHYKKLTIYPKKLSHFEVDLHVGILAARQTNRLSSRIITFKAYLLKGNLSGKVIVMQT